MRKGGDLQAARKPLQAVIPSPFAVILSPSPVFLSEAKNLRSWLRVNTAKDLRISLRVNSARNLALSIFNAVRDSSSSANKNGGLLGMTGQTGFPAACLTPPPAFPREAGLDGGAHAAACGELAAHHSPLGAAGMGHIIQDAVYGVLVENAQISVRKNIVLQ